MSDLQTVALPPRFIDVKSPRASNDWYQDQPEATEALLRVERFSGLSWDPACGIGTIPKTFAAAGLKCWGSDIVDRGYAEATRQDFLNPDDAPGSTGYFANIVSNPPFNLARQFVDKALSIATHKVAMLLPLTFLEGAERARWRINTPLARIRTFSWRISMPPGELLQAGKVRPTGGKKAFAWFIWDHTHQGPAHEIPLIKEAA
jgi:hypothetical protein